MERAGTIIRRGEWQGEPSDNVTLDETGRHRRRIRLETDGGLPILLDLPDATLLRDGDALKLDDGRLIAVRSVPEPLYDVRAADPAPEALLRLAWHLGNRHLAAQIFPDRILIRRDHVIKAMLEGLGAKVAEIEAPFDPEGGAYGQSHGNGHDHAHHHHG